MRHPILLFLALLLAGCSSVSNLPEGETLYTGLKKIAYTDPADDDYSTTIQEEVEAALACAPNGALLGSSYYRTPLQLRLWIYNTYANSERGFGAWMRKSFGSEPVLLGNVNPELRAQIARNVLRNNGYFGAQVSSQVVPAGKRKAKISYTITKGPLHRFDSVRYAGYPTGQDTLIRHAMAESLLQRGKPFSVAALDGERGRLNTLMRNNGYYYYNAGYTSYLADSTTKNDELGMSNEQLAAPQSAKHITPNSKFLIPNSKYGVDVLVQPVSDLPAEAARPWYLGKLRIDMRRTITEQPTDSIFYKGLSVFYTGKKPPIRLRTLLRDMKLRPRKLYRQNEYLESMSTLNGLGVFSLTDLKFTPHDTTATCDTLDMQLTCVFDKPYDGTISADFAVKSNDRMGPGLTLDISKRNAFRGAELLSLKLKGSYEWQTGNSAGANGSHINSYEYGADLSITYPRLETPFRKLNRRRFYAPPSTAFNISATVLNRANFFRMLTVGAGVAYKWRTSAQSGHEFSPFTLDYNYLQSTTQRFRDVMDSNPAIYVSMRDQFVPKIKYTYTYTSPATCKNPIAWETTLTEASNIMSLGYMAAGKRWGDKGKDLFGNPYAQFLKISTSLRKTWLTGYKQQLVGRVAAGAIWSYGNSDRAPYTEQFYVGGANSIRAFTVRSIGPGKYVAKGGSYSYLDQTGDIKLEANLEYRFNIFGDLYGAAFLDAGNVWLMKDDSERPDAKFDAGKFWKQIATGTGLGIRYDMEFIVIRLDLGVALHVPYDTGKSGYYNIPKFKDGLGLHFAIGYPF